MILQAYWMNCGYLIWKTINISLLKNVIDFWKVLLFSEQSVMINNDFAATWLIHRSYKVNHITEVLEKVLVGVSKI